MYARYSTPLQVEADKLELFKILAQVPVKIVHYLHKAAQAGYDKMYLQLQVEDSGEQEGVEDETEVRVE